jgi:hypothetical protein
MLWLVTFAAVAQGGINFLPPKPAVGCSNQCVGGYASTPYDGEEFEKFRGQFTGAQAQLEQMSQYHCTASGLSQIVTTTECTAAGKALGVSKGPAVESDHPMCIYDPVNKILAANDGKYGLFGGLATGGVDEDNNPLVLCHCRSCDESTSLQSPWWTVLGVGLGVCVAGGAVAAARA